VERMCVYYILVHWLVCDCWFCCLELEPFLSTWGTVAVGTLGSGAIMLCIEQELNILSEY